jgi:hypothetical protein
MSKTKLMTFVEQNQWEHETWRFYVLLTEKQEAKLRELISSQISACYKLENCNHTKEDAKEMARTSRSGYLCFHNWCGKITNPLPETVDWYGEDPFYKGGIRDYCSEKK